MSTIPRPQFYVYILARPNGDPFYVGKGQGYRIHVHETEARSGHKCHKCNIIRKIWKDGGEVQRYTVLTTDDEQEALTKERELISLLGWETLCNVSSGGDPATAVYTEEYREKRRKIQLAKHQDPDFRAKYEAGIARRRIPIEHLRRAIAIRNADPEYRERTRQRTLEQMGTPEARQGASDRTKARFTDPEQRRKLSEQIKAKWADPEYRAKTTAARWKRKRANDGSEETEER